MNRTGIAALLATLVFASSGSFLAFQHAPEVPKSSEADAPKRILGPGVELERKGDEIMVCGKLIHTSTRVVLWTDPGGYDAYRVERRFAPLETASWEKTHAEVKDVRSPARYGTRKLPLSPEELERVRGGGWDLPLLQKHVDQFVIHYDARGTSRGCFEILHDKRGLSVHFMLDLDGTVYQTLDLKEGAWHATIANPRSIGIEVANIGAYPEGAPNPFGKWYSPDGSGGVRLLVPDAERGLAPKGKVFHPSRAELVRGSIQGESLVQYDFTPEQYEALARLTAALCTIFPKITLDYPRESGGKLETKKLEDERYRDYHGILGHFHVQANKIDPGPAFQWDKLINEAKAIQSNPKSAPAAKP